MRGVTLGTVLLSMAVRLFLKPGSFPAPNMSYALCNTPSAVSWLHIRFSIEVATNGTEDFSTTRRAGRLSASVGDKQISAKERNRLAQQRFRERQKQRINGLQQKVTELTAHVCCVSIGVSRGLFAKIEQ